MEPCPDHPGADRTIGDRRARRPARMPAFGPPRRARRRLSHARIVARPALARASGTGSRRTRCSCDALVESFRAQARALASEGRILRRPGTAVPVNGAPLAAPCNACAVGLDTVAGQGFRPAGLEHVATAAPQPVPAKVARVAPWGDAGALNPARPVRAGRSPETTLKVGVDVTARPADRRSRGMASGPCARRDLRKPPASIGPPSAARSPTARRLTCVEHKCARRMRTGDGSAAAVEPAPHHALQSAPRLGRVGISAVQIRR